eukprot:13821518-Heterocapsa_arctica.AAC.1
MPSSTYSPPVDDPVPWDASLPLTLERARAQGLYVGTTSWDAWPDWWCPHCEGWVNQWYLNDHLRKEKHKQRRYLSVYLRALLAASLLKQLPSWVFLDSTGYQRCRLCKNALMDWGHIT